MRPKLLALLSAGALMCLAPASAFAARLAHPLPSYYVALGDSLARGAQPNAAGTTLPTNDGYANFLFSTEKSQSKKLKLEELGCPGETTTSMLSGGTYC